MSKKIILVVGAGGKIGSNLSKELSLYHNIVLSDIDPKKLSNLKKNINSKNIKLFNGDLTKSKIIDKLINFTKKNFNRIDTVVFCAYPKSKKYGVKFGNLKEKFLREDLYNQLGSLIIFCQKISKIFIKQNSGNIIFISSIQGVCAPKFDHYRDLNMTSPIEYSVIKAGIISLTKYLSKYFRKKNIRVNCVSPGGIEDNQHSKFKKRYRESCNSKGLLNSKDVVSAIKFLISSDSKYINGHNLIVDDGWSL